MGSVRRSVWRRTYGWSLDCKTVSKGVAGFKRPTLKRMHWHTQVFEISLCHWWYGPAYGQSKIPSDFCHLSLRASEKGNRLHVYFIYSSEFS